MRRWRKKPANTHIESVMFKGHFQLTLRPLLHSPDCGHKSVIIDRTDKISDKGLIVAILSQVLRLPLCVTEITVTAFQNKSRRNIEDNRLRLYSSFIFTF